MTLENIFFGKKVVKQAYLNNALIYQSKGWETLPSTYQEQWIKSYDKSVINAIAKDDSNNIYMGAGVMLYKVGPDGDLKWKTNVKANIDNIRQINGIVVLPGCVYCAFIEMQTNTDGFISKFDINGNLISTININTLSTSLANTYFVGMVNDKSNIYAITSSLIYKLDFNLKVIDYTTVPYTAGCIAINNGPYVFVGTGKFGVRFNKDNLKNSINLVGNVNINLSTTSIALDSIGHVYLGSTANNSLYIFNAENCQLLETRFLGNNSDKTYSFYSDNQDNLYVVYQRSTNYVLRKYSSDGTLIWDNLSIPTSSASIKIITDSNNNIYVCYLDSSSNLTIKKCINLIKKGI